MLFTGKLWPKLYFCLAVNSHVIVATHRTGVTVLIHVKLCLWPHLAASRRHRWYFLWSQVVHNLHKCHKKKKKRKEIIRHKSLTKHFCLFLYIFSPAAFVYYGLSSCWTLVWHDHKTLNTRHTRMIYICWRSEQKGPFVKGRLNFVMSLLLFVLQLGLLCHFVKM